MVLVAILAIVDMLAAGFILFNFHMFANYLAFIFLLKGLFSLASSLSMHYVFDWMGYFDVAAGICFLFMSFGWFFGFFSTVGWLILLKGIYSFIRYMLRF